MATDQNVTLLSSIVEKRQNGMVSFSLSGEPEAAAICTAVVADYHRVTGTHAPTTEDLLECSGDKVTILRAGQGMFGSGSIVATPGTIFTASGGTPALLPKGARKNGFKLKNLMDICPGYAGVERFRQRVNLVRATFPQLVKLTQADLDALPHRSNACSLAVFGTHRMPDGPSAGAIWVLHSYQKADDIVEGAMFIRSEDGVSEHGSVFGKDLLRFGGKVVDFGGMTFKEALDLTDREYHDILPLFVK